MRTKEYFFLCLTLLVVASVTHAQDPYGILKKPIPDKTVVLTFDDGCKSDVELVAPLLKKNGFGATFYITQGLSFKTRKDWYLTWDEIKSIEKMGFEIGNHTVKHMGLSAHSLETCIKETVGMEEAFKQNGIAHPTTFCWPLYRVKNQFLDVLAEKGYLFARGGHNRPYDPVQDNPLDMPSYTLHDRAMEKGFGHFTKMVEEARDGKIVVFCLHGVPFDEHPGASLKPETFEQVVNHLKEKGCNVISMRDLAQYIDPAKAVLYLSQPKSYPWGRCARDWGWVKQQDSTLYIGIRELPADRKIELPRRMTTRIGKAWLAADPQKRAIDVSVSDEGISTIAVPETDKTAYGTSPLIVMAELTGAPSPTILDFGFPGLPDVTMVGDQISVEVPKAANIKKLAPHYKTGSEKVKGSPASGTELDFSKPQKYLVTSPDGRSRTYTVTVKQKEFAVGPANASFEIFDSLDQRHGAWGRTPSGTFWTFTKQHRNATMGIVSLESYAIAANPPLDGSRHCGALGGKGSSISQDVVFDRGAYTISFDRSTTHRASVSYPSVNVAIDDRILMTLKSRTFKGGWDKRTWTQHSTPAFSVDEGKHTIRFIVGDDAEESNYNLRGVNLIDNVTIKVKQ